LMLKFPGFSSETCVKIINRTTTPYPLAKMQLKNPFVRPEERFRQSRHFSDSSDIHWICSYGTALNDYLFTIKQTKDGGYLATGKSYDTNNRNADAVLLKLNSEGSIEWQKSYGRENQEAYYPCSVAETSDSGYILATDSVNADSSNAQDIDILVLKLSSDGSILWQKTYGRDTSKNYVHGEIQQTPDGGYILIGTITPLETNISSILLLKLDSTGNILWDKIFKTPGLQRGDSVQQTSDGGYIVGGGAFGYPGIRSSEKGHPLILKLDSNGNIEWQKLYEGYGRFSSYRTSVITTRDNGYLVADSVEYSKILSQWGEWEYDGDFWVFKLDSAGNILWQNLYGGSGWDQAFALCETRDGGYAVGGYTESYGRGSSEGWILKLDSTGNITWQKTYGEINAANLLFNISQKNNGDFLAAGYIVRMAQSDMLALNISEEGEIGVGCEWVMNSGAIATPTFAVPIDTELASMNAGLISNFSTASSANLSLTQELLCWNLHQPPINVSLRTEINRSLYVKEFYNFLSWEPNPVNDKFSVAEYRIYRRVSEGKFEHLKTVPANTFEYMDMILRTGEVYKYAVTSVDSEGRESPKSVSVFIS
jgi:hypothetical protein